MRDVKRNINGQLQENEDWFNRRYNEDATQRADAQRLLQMTEDRIRQRNQAAAGQAAIGGASTEAAAAQAAENAQTDAAVTSAVNANAEAQKNDIERRYMANKAVLNDQLNGMQAAKAQSIAQAVQGTNDFSSALGNVLGDVLKKKEGGNGNG